MIQPRQNGDRPSNPHAGEQGYLLLGLLFLFVIILIGLALAAPKVAKEIQREKEIETVHRGEQYKRAIQLYYRKFGAYPMSMDQLKETNQVRFLRQVYIDPMTGKKDWKLLHLGQVQMTTLGFFGQVVQAGGAIPVAGRQGANGTAATGTLGAGGTAGGIGGSTFGASSGLGSNSSLGGGLNSNSNSNSSDTFFNDTSSNDTQANGKPSANSSNGSENGSSVSPNDQGQEASTGDSVADDNSGGIGGGESSPGTSPNSGPGGISAGGLNSGGFGSTAGGGGFLSSSNSPGNGSFGSANGAPSVPGLAGSTAAGGGLSGASAAGAPIVGVTVPLKKHSILVYRKKKIYDQWQFVYNPQEEVAAAVGQGAGQSPGIGTPAGQPTSNGIGGDNSIGSSGSGLGSSGGGFGASSREDWVQPAAGLDRRRPAQMVRRITPTQARVNPIRFSES